MAAAGQFSGPLLLLEPSFSRADEMKELGMVDRVGRVPGVGLLAWKAMIGGLGMFMKKELPGPRHDALVADMKRTDARFCREMVAIYFEYLDRHGSLVERLCASGVNSVVVFGDRSEVGLADDERRGLDACPNATLVDIADAGHMLMVDQAARTAELIVELYALQTAG